jgi:2-polyprenyl-3-methyl-5-hydroxy-6-metoxy-1,4-benzoquinol methylase
MKSIGGRELTEAAESSNYILAAQGREVHEIGRLELLQTIFDPTTRRRLDMIQPGWRCLEVGAGRGSVARFLSDRVGPTGEVIAADIDIQPLSELDLPNGRVIKHNILVDSLAPVGGPASFDLVHARFVLQHIYDHEDLAIKRMAELLKPGGWLVIEDIDATTMAAADPAHPLSERFNQNMAGAVVAMRASHSVDPEPGRALQPRFARAGLADIRHEAFLYVEPGGSPLCQWYAQSTEGSYRAYANAGQEETYRLTMQALSDPHFWLQSGGFHCAWGRKQ